jgi:hypothetical protein
MCSCSHIAHTRTHSQSHVALTSRLSNFFNDSQMPCSTTNQSFTEPPSPKTTATPSIRVSRAGESSVDDFRVDCEFGSSAVSCVYEDEDGASPTTPLAAAGKSQRDASHALLSPCDHDNAARSVSGLQAGKSVRMDNDIAINEALRRMSTLSVPFSSSPIRSNTIAASKKSAVRDVLNLWLFLFCCRLAQNDTMHRVHFPRRAIGACHARAGTRARNPHSCPHNPIRACTRTRSPHPYTHHRCVTQQIQTLVHDQTSFLHNHTRTGIP